MTRELLLLITIACAVTAEPTFQIVPFPPCTEERALDAVRRISYAYGVDLYTRLANITFTPAEPVSRPCNASFHFVDPPNDSVAGSEYKSAARLSFYLSILQPYAISEVIAAQNISWFGSIVSIPTPVPSPIPTAPTDPFTNVTLTAVFDLTNFPLNCLSFTERFAAWMSISIDRLAVQAHDCPKSITFAFTDASDTTTEPSADSLLLAVNAQSKTALLQATGARAVVFSNESIIADLQRNLQPVFADNITNTLFSLAVDGSIGGPQWAAHNILEKLTAIISTTEYYAPLFSTWLSESTLVVSLSETAAPENPLTECFYSIRNEGIVKLPIGQKKNWWWVAGPVVGAGVGVVGVVFAARRVWKRRANDDKEAPLVQ